MFKKLRLDTVAYDKAIYSNIVQMIKLRNPEEFKDDRNGRSNHACSGIANILVEAGIYRPSIVSQAFVTKEKHIHVIRIHKTINEDFNRLEWLHIVYTS